MNDVHKRPHATSKLKLCSQHRDMVVVVVKDGIRVMVVVVMVVVVGLVVIVVVVVDVWSS